PVPARGPDRRLSGMRLSRSPFGSGLAIGPKSLPSSSSRLRRGYDKAPRGAMELAVVRTAAGESPDQLAQYVEQLRISFGHVGGGTSKPEPLFFENALRECVADYALDDDARSGEDEVADDEDATEPASVSTLQPTEAVELGTL